MTMKVALIQVSAGPDKELNLRKAVKFVERAAKAGAEFILLPEIFVFRGKLTSGNLKEIAESIPGQITGRFGELAKKYKVSILAGSIFEKADGKKVYNTSVLIDDHGQLRAKYRKMNLFSARLGKRRIREEDNFYRGKNIVLTKVQGFRVGLSVCFDLRFPALYEQYFKRGAGILTVPSAFTKKTGRAHWEVLLRARAIENQCFVLAPNQIGEDYRGIASYGNSMVVDPWGRILARASGNKEEIIYADINMKDIKQAKQILPLKRRRP